MEWIKIDERMPKEGDMVLIYDMAFGRNVAEYKDGKFMYHFSDWNVFYEHVTYWMHLPDPPNENTNEIKYEVYMTNNSIWDKFIVVIGNNVFGLSPDELAIDDSGVYYGTKKSCSDILEYAIKLDNVNPYIKEKIERIIKHYDLKNI